MANPALSYVTVRFKNNVPIKVSTQGNLLANIGDYIKSKVGNDYYLEISEVDRYENELYFRLDSSREQNLIWQLEQCLDFFKHYKDKYEFVEFESSSYSFMDTGCGYYNVDEDG